MSDQATPEPGQHGSAGEVFRVALRLGVTSFGGPVAHIGYFERTYVRQLAWLTQSEFAGLVALCQLVPGPASSQLSYLIGLRRAGWPGALAAWAGFTLPAAIAMFALALIVRAGFGNAAFELALVHGLKLVAVAIVAQALVDMARSACSDAARIIIAVLALAMMLTLHGPWSQILTLALGALLGVTFNVAARDRQQPPSLPISRRAGAISFVAFAVLLALAIGIGAGGEHNTLRLAAIFYRAGALVFGGGHVVLPLLRAALVPTGWISDQLFLAGYGAVQAMPGPLFTLSAYLGAASAPLGAPWPLAMLWAAVALVAMFLPGVLIATAGSVVWNWLGQHPRAGGGLAGINAAVVGLLGAAFYNPVARTALLRPIDGLIALSGFTLLIWRRTPPIVVAIAIVSASLLLR